MCALSDVPLEILTQILYILERQDLAQVARVCKWLQDPAEQLSWSHLKIDDTSILFSSVDGRANTLFTSFLGGLPRRAGFVKHLEYQITSRNLNLFLQTVSHVHVHFRTLTIHSSPNYLLRSASGRQNAAEALVEAWQLGNIRFNALQEVHIPLEYHFELLFDYIFSHSPSLQELRINPMIYSSIPPRAVLLHRGPLDQLRSVHVERMVEEYIPFISHILTSCPDLEQLHLGDIHTRMIEGADWTSLMQEARDRPRSIRTDIGDSSLVQL